MILSAIMNLITDAIVGLVSFVTPVSASLGSAPSEAVPVLRQILALIAYFIPLGGLMPILIFFVAVDSAMFGWRLGMRIKSFIPTMGN